MPNGEGFGFVVGFDCPNFDSKFNVQPSVESCKKNKLLIFLKDMV